MTIIFILSVSAFAQFKATGNAPQVTGTDTAEINKLNQEFKEAFDEALTMLNEELSVLKLNKFIQAMGNSAVYANYGATQRGYGGYDKFAITAGSMIGIQLPTGIAKLMNEIENLGDNIIEEGDLDFGISQQVLNLQVGMNTSFLLKGLYLGAKISYFNLPNLLEEFSYRNFSIGVTGNYQLVRPISIAKVITWRGISLGSGLIFQNSKLGMSFSFSDFSEEVSEGAKIEMNTPASLNFNINTITIPLEVVTAVKLVFLNVHLGLGADLAFGKSNLNFGMDTAFHLEDLPAGVTESQKGEISVNANESKAPTFFNFKIMTGLGFSLGPVVIDIPITFYPMKNGYNIGITAGLTF
jgi:hypothetical protein